MDSMNGNYTALEELGTVALDEREKVEEVKARIGVDHGDFDAWIYGFLENRSFDVEETVAKLERRFVMEVNELATYELTEYKRQSMQSGVIQEIGKDKKGRTILYVKVKRDFPQAKDRTERQQLFDIYVSYATRIRADSKRCQVILLVDQEGASMLKNIDMTSSTEIALRTTNLFPGAVEKIYLCNMGGIFTRVVRPILQRLPGVVSNRLSIVTFEELQRGELRDLIEDSVLPVSLGGVNELREPATWLQFAERVEAYFVGLKRAVTERGMRVKTWELEQLSTTHPLPEKLLLSVEDKQLSVEGSPTEEDRAVISCSSGNCTKTDEGILGEPSNADESAVGA